MWVDAPVTRRTPLKPIVPNALANKAAYEAVIAAQIKRIKEAKIAEGAPSDLRTRIDDLLTLAAASTAFNPEDRMRALAAVDPTNLGPAAQTRDRGCILTRSATNFFTRIWNFRSGGGL